MNFSHCVIKTQYCKYLNVAMLPAITHVMLSESPQEET